MFVPFAEGHVLGVEAALQKEVGQGLEKVFGAYAEVFTGVLGIFDLHRRSLVFMGVHRRPFSTCRRIAQTLKTFNGRR
jgi:hypothetical protein